MTLERYDSAGNVAERDAVLSANGYGGTAMQDAQNGVFRYNTFGQATIDGVFYPHNGSGPKAMQFSEGNKTTSLYNAEAYGNTLGGEYIQGYAMPDHVVYCANNRNYTQKAKATKGRAGTGCVPALPIALTTCSTPLQLAAHDR